MQELSLLAYLASPHRTFVGSIIQEKEKRYVKETGKKRNRKERQDKWQTASIVSRKHYV